MAVTYIDNGFDDAIAKVGEALIKRLNYKNERAAQLAANPATLMALAPVYRQAKEVGQEANFFAGLQVDPSFGSLLDAYPETEEQLANKLKSKIDIAQSQEILSSGIIPKEMKERLAKTETGLNLLNSYNTYISDLPDTPLGNHMKKMAGVAFANPGFLDHIEKHEASEGGTGGGDASDRLVEYNRWRTSYNQALDRYRDPKNKDNKAQLRVDVNNLAQLGEELMKANKIPIAPITGIVEERAFLGMGTKLKEFQFTPELVNPAAVAVESVIKGVTPEGNKVTVEDLKKSKFYNDLQGTDQGKLMAVIESAKSEATKAPEENPDKIGVFDVADKLFGGVVRAPFKAADKAVELGLRGGRAIGEAVSGKDKAKEKIEKAKAPTKITSVPLTNAYKGTKPDVQLADWATRKGFRVTSDTIPGGHNVDSLHDQRLAIDIGTREKKPSEIARIMAEAQAIGLRVLDERTRPKGQKVWNGPHVHIEINPDEADKRNLSLNEYIDQIMNKLKER